MTQGIVIFIRAMGHVVGALGVVAGFGALVYLAMPGGWLWIPAVIWLLPRWSRNRTADVLGAVEQGITLQLPVPVVLDASRESWVRGAKMRMEQLAKRLRQGEPVGHAIVKGMPELSDRWRGLIVAGDRRGQLLPAIRRVLEEQRQFVMQDNGRSLVIVYLLYVAMIAWVFSLLLWPSFMMIFEDFDTPLPPFVNSVVTLSADGWFILLPLPVILLLCGAILCWIAGSGMGLWHLFATLGWWLPGPAQVIRPRSYADVCGAVADATEAGMTLPEAMDSACALSIPYQLRKKLESCATKMRQGQPPADAAGSSGLPAMFQAMLRFTGDVRSLSSGFDLVGKQYEWRYHRRIVLVHRTVVGLLFLLVAGLVGSFAYAIMLAIVTLQWSILPPGVY